MALGREASISDYFCFLPQIRGAPGKLCDPDGQPVLLLGLLNEPAYKQLIGFRVVQNAHSLVDAGLQQERKCRCDHC